MIITYNTNEVIELNKKRYSMKEKEISGLTSKAAEQLYKQGKNNFSVKAPSKTVKEIVKDNVYTYFNLVFLVIAILLTLVGSFRDLTFLPIIIANTLIGIIQEIRSKKVLDKLTMLNAPTATVIRDGKEQVVTSDKLVLNDIVVFSSGDQICADAIVIEGQASVNESLLTGEADEITKTKDDELMSGSFIVSGRVYAKLTKVGADSYISKLTLQAKAVNTKEQSEIIRSLNKIVKLAGIVIIPIGLILFVQQFFIGGATLKASVQGMVASVIGMIPEGLFLLASVTLALSAMRLAKNKVLLHDMKSIETLARVNVLCVDKTGTITDTNMEVEHLEVIEKCGLSNDEIRGFLSDFAYYQDADNPTMLALKNYFITPTGRVMKSVSSFSSEFKYSGVNFEDESCVLGAPEFLLKNDYHLYKDIVEKHSKLGYRVVVFGKYDGKVDGKGLTKKMTPYAFIMLSNPIRKSAKETFKYFKDQGVEIKVISGDNPLTVSEVSKKAGIAGAENYVDASTLTTDESIEEAVLKYTIFGRVTPLQKRKFVRALQKNGKTVAMTGDGVNDVLALKDADCGIAMASGSEAAVQASELVLLESDFSKMPDVVREGRQVVNNLERSGSLFLVKNIFSFCISILAIFFQVKYPLQPSQISLISMFTIGVPGLFLSQIPNEDLIKGKFINNLLFKAIPGAITDTIIVAAMVTFGTIFEASEGDISTASTILLSIIGIMVLYNISKPMNKYKWAIWIMCTLGLVFSIIFFKELFGITSNMSIQGILLCINFALISEVFFRYLTKLSELLKYLTMKLKQIN